jgi:diaminopimelate epimerase
MNNPAGESQLLAFTKMNGAGNDFIIIDARADDFDQTIRETLGVTHRKELARLLCRRGFSIGADGLVLVGKASDADFSWDFYNSDGSQAEMCGNAARCVARFAYMNGIVGEDMKIKTAVGVIKAKILKDNRVLVIMLPPKLVAKEPPLLIDSGVPHAVIKENKINDTRKLREIATASRFPKTAGPRGANVTFYALTGERALDAITFERGVEDFTLACGTGALAAAYAAKLELPDQENFEVRMPGGRLEVEFPKEQNIVLLRGPALVVYEGHVTKEACHENF